MGNPAGGINAQRALNDIVSTTSGPGPGFGSQAALLAAVRALAIAAGFLAAAFGARVLGADGMGAAGVGLTVAAIGAVALNGGVNIATVYLLGRLPDQRRSVLSAVVPIASTGVLLAAGGLFAFAPAISSFVGLHRDADVLWWSSLLAASLITYEFIGALLLGFGRARDYIRLEFTKALATLGSTVLLLSLNPTAANFVAAAIMGQTIGIATSIGAIRPDRVDARPTARPGLKREALSIGLRGQVGNILQLLNLRLDQLLVPAILSLSAGGIYVVAVRVSEALAQVGSAAATLVFPAVAREPDATLTALTERVVRVTTLLVALSAIAVALIADPLLEIAFGSEFASGAEPLRLLLAATVPLALTRVLAGDLKGRGRPGVVSALTGGTAGLTIVLDLLLIPSIGITGAALASLIAYSVSAAAFLILFVRTTGARGRSLIPTVDDVRHLVELVRGR